MTEIIQGSPEWFAARLGKVTASRVADVIARTKSGWGASRANYMAELVAERLTGTPAASFINAAMQHGIDQEPNARAAYEFRANVDVQLVGFVDHPTIAMSGASPDGLVGSDGLLEIKAPQTATHIDMLLTRKIPEKYITQMMWQMACTGRKWCDFVSFDPRMPEAMSILAERVERNNEIIAGLERDVSAFLAELDAKVAALRERYEQKARAA